MSAKPTPAAMRAAVALYGSHNIERNGGTDSYRELLAGVAAIIDRETGLKELVEALRLILPMAKGYAVAHPVGNNMQFIQEAQTALARATKPA